jgi:hypothetical protein
MTRDAVERYIVRVELQLIFYAEIARAWNPDSKETSLFGWRSNMDELGRVGGNSYGYVFGNFTRNAIKTTSFHI